MHLNAVVEGPRDAPPLVLLCSLGSTVDMWTPQRRDLAGGYRVISLDTRGHGGSPVPDGPCAVADLAADVLETLDDLGVERASFAGVSLGGAIAQAIALGAPERVATLVLLCTSARFGDPEPWHERAATVRAGGVGAVADAVVARWFTPRYAQAEPATVDAMRSMISATPAAGYAACCEAIAGWDVISALGAVSAPTLVIAGAEDPATPPAHAEVIASTVPGARLEVLDDAAHLASYQRPEVITPMIRDHVGGAR